MDPGDYSLENEETMGLFMRKFVTLLQRQEGGAEVTVLTCVPEVMRMLGAPRGVKAGDAFVTPAHVRVVLSPHFCQFFKKGKVGDELGPTRATAQAYLRAGSARVAAKPSDTDVARCMLEMMVGIAENAKTPNDERAQAILSAKQLLAGVLDVTFKALLKHPILRFAQCHGLGSASGHNGNRKQPVKDKHKARSRSPDAALGPPGTRGR